MLNEQCPKLDFWGVAFGRGSWGEETAQAIRDVHGDTQSERHHWVRRHLEIKEFLTVH